MKAIIEICGLPQSMFMGGGIPLDTFREAVIQKHGGHVTQDSSEPFRYDAILAAALPCYGFRYEELGEPGNPESIPKCFSTGSLFKGFFDMVPDSLQSRLTEARPENLLVLVDHSERGEILGDLLQNMGYTVEKRYIPGIIHQEV